MRAWLLVVIWASIIFTASTDTFSSEHTQGPIVTVLHAVFPHMAESTLFLLHDFIRKCTHFFEYLIFGVLLFRAVRAPNQGWQWRWALLAILLAAFYASSDEIHQIFVPSRGASAWDAILDTFGAAVAQLALWRVNQGKEAAVEKNARAGVS